MLPIMPMIGMNATRVLDQHDAAHQQNAHPASAVAVCIYQHMPP
jgi:hypothetical protein